MSKPDPCAEKRKKLRIKNINFKILSKQKNITKTRKQIKEENFIKSELVITETSESVSAATPFLLIAKIKRAESIIT